MPLAAKDTFNAMLAISESVHQCRA